MPVRAYRPVALISLLWLGASAVLSSCGGGDDGGTGGGGTGGGGTGGGSTFTPIAYNAGVFQPAASFAAQCQAPRTGTNPATSQPYADRQGTTNSENHWLRSWTNDTYLWFDEVPDRDPALTSTTVAYFDLLKTSATLASGQAKDRFHYTLGTTEWRQLSQSGVEVGYGAQWAVLSSRPPRKVMVALTQPSSPATAPAAQLARGAEVLTVDGIDVVSNNTTAGIDTINAGLFPSAGGQTHTFTIRDRGASTTRVVSLQTTTVTSTPVQRVAVLQTVTGKVGYMLFNDHIATAEQQLITAITTLRNAGVQDLVLDLRYNGGGYLDIASELAYMIAGPGATAGRVFERLQFNSKHPSTDPVTGEPLVPVPFYTTSQGFTVASGQALPTLNLSRVFVLTSDDTCSASESIINGLKGAGVEVRQFGANTCGKPYGFHPQDNCGTTYFSIQFKGVNNSGFGDYPEGFSATRVTAPAAANLPGCGTADDFTHDLGDVAEGQLAAALASQAGQSCPAPLPAAALTGKQAAATSSRGEDGQALSVPSTPWRQNRLLRD